MLILAGITINALTGSDSAPAKANEAEQKNDIGTAKDQIAVSAINAKTAAYETAYVGNSVSAGNAATTIGQAVIDAVLPFNGTSTGKASISVEQTTKNEKPDDAKITITTRDFEVIGTITIDDGILTWGEIEPNIPGVFLDKTGATLNPNGTLTLTARKKNVSENITWTITGDSTITKTEDNEDNLKVTINVALGANDGESAVLKASAGGYESTCTITVEKVPVQKVSFNNAPTSIDKGNTVTLTITTTDNSNKPATPTSVTFASSDTTVATIGATSGELEGKKAGTTIISVTASDGTNSANASFSLTVNPSTADAVNAAIGQIINYSANNVSSWRVFYADANYMYIISTTNAVTGYGLDGGSKAGKNKYSDGALSAVFTTPQSGGKKNYSNVTYGATYNSKWLATGKSDNLNRSRAAAYLCDPSEWDDYVSSTAPSGTFAVGGPTKELLVKSWNEAKANGRTGDPTTTATWNDSSDVGDGGYTYNSPTALSSSVSPYPIGTGVVPVTVSGTSYGLYNPINSGSTGNHGYWLASPCSNHYNTVCYVSDDGYVGNGYYYSTDYGVRPVVAIPISSVTVSSGTVSVNRDGVF